jgi:hypothetical protein
MDINEILLKVVLNTIPTVIEFLHDISMKGSEREI